VPDESLEMLLTNVRMRGHHAEKGSDRILDEGHQA